MFVRIVPTSILHRRPQVLGSIGATTIVTRGGTLLLFVMFVRQYKLWQALLLSMAITFAHYFVFKICFSVPLPEKFLGLIGF